MNLWSAISGYSWPVECTRESYFVGPAKWEEGRNPYFDWAAVHVKGKDLADFVACAVNSAIMEGFTIGQDYSSFRWWDEAEETRELWWKMYTPLPDIDPESRWLCHGDQEDPTEDSDFDFNVTHPISVRHQVIAEFVLFAINHAIAMVNKLEDGGF